MKPASFDYVRVSSKREVLQLLHEHGEDARVLAGGQSLMATLNMRLTQPKLVIDINRVEELRSIRNERGHLAVGAAVRQVELTDRTELATEVPLLAQALPWIGHFQTRNRGTVCGSVAHADPSAEIPLCLVTLGGTVVLESLKGKRREVPAADFFQGLLTTARQPRELISEVRFPLAQDGTEYRFREIAMRHGDFALVALALCLSDHGARLGVGGVADRPVAQPLPLGDALPDTLNTLAWSLGAQDDIHASAAYRRQLVRELGRRLIEEPSHARTR
ncbi:Molybdopterin dehydrogenase FAD-binding protein [Alloalcanivorax dieselolei B5]|uniref:Molybdopterin dehydrogenase FAD-binding protein n=1 Tax=Alcanivorax dieselolei (strain DSM 16502 / CGMCC 1.3690 / MCCC 1A00001 / B-5) TaxID=930169 RepID=K0CC22_ALCDB|nr:FAD binding domain-containing protein [Alloalcanivorax dieselolei]AFT71114.1 Molybdopterin dehydrogenase FAD-binding protein [Alloalcanivorax dieselolei B5]GGJ93169.1 carbon monoxide dehydrogenase [Alloalcanivorax dieselolei]